MRPLLRIVRLSFNPELTEKFEHIFEESQPLIASFEGCIGVEVKKDASQPNIYYTVSHWETLEALENYRHSELFKATWTKTKALFNDKPMVFSLVDVD